METFEVYIDPEEVFSYTVDNFETDLRDFEITEEEIAEALVQEAQVDLDRNESSPEISEVIAVVATQMCDRCGQL